MGNIYKITNLINGKMYIGLTTHDIDKRWHNHIKDSKSKKKKKEPYTVLLKNMVLRILKSSLLKPFQ